MRAWQRVLFVVAWFALLPAVAHAQSTLAGTVKDSSGGLSTVTFTLTGFATVIREGVEMAGVAVTTINTDLRVGTVQETITVTGETPIVDVQSARRGPVLNNEPIKELPARRGYNAIVARCRR